MKTMFTILSKYQITKLLNKQQLQASMLSLGILSAALFTLWLGHLIPDQLPETLEIRELTLAPPTPPPIPPQSQQTSIDTSVSIDIQGNGAIMPMLEIKPIITPQKPDAPLIKKQQSQWQSLEVNWDSFNLNQLDALPTLLTPVRITFPKSLIRQGIKRALVKLDVMINEQGQVSLINIVKNSHPELISEIQRLVRNTRFTAPTKDSQTVRARFIWPVEITP
jgi:protein TonB